MTDVGANESWRTLRLRRVAKLVTDKATNSSFDVALENIESRTGRLIESEGEFSTEGVAFRPGDLLFGKLRPYLAKAWVADREGAAVGDFHVLRPMPDVDPNFLRYCVLEQQFLDEVNSSTFGAKMPRVGWDFLAGMTLLLPSVGLQRRIVRFLDRETAEIDALIEKQERLIALLEEKRQAAISHAVTKGLDPNAPMKDSGIPWLGDIPTHWRTTKLGFISWVRARLGWKGLKADEYVDDGFVFLSTPNVKGERIDFDDVNFISAERFFESPEIILKEGDILLAKDGSTLGTSNIVRVLHRPATVNSSLAVITPSKDVDPLFLHYVLRGHAFQNTVRQQKGGMGVPHLFQADLVKFVIALPPLDEQKAIAKKLDAMTSDFLSGLRSTHASLALLRERRAALISAAVTGKIDIAGRV